ncbi:MAG TPA: YlxR family protein [Chloroflexia bacterium]|nr:YlxR family protein [Chloroflexia bacterium]
MAAKANKQKQQQRPRHVPQRTCVACRTTGAKRGLVRVVRSAEGTVEVDETGKKPGRGAYLCRTSECWDKALKGKVLEYALKTAITAEDKTALQAYAATLEAQDDDTPEGASNIVSSKEVSVSE